MNSRIIALLLTTLALPLAAQQGALKVKTNSGRTGVFVDGKYLGPSANFHMSRKYSLSAGSHEIILREPRFEEFKGTVTIEAGKTTTFRQQLTAKPVVMPPFGMLKLKGFEKYSAVYLNGAYMGFADEFDLGRQGLFIKPGDYDLEITSESGASLYKNKLIIQADRTETIRKP
jgi:hypothetical protein